MKKIILSAIVLLPMLAYSHGGVLELTEASVSKAIENFEKEPQDVTSAYSYLKSWTSGSLIKVKIYYGSEGSGITYSCEMKHEGAAEEMVCDKKL